MVMNMYFFIAAYGSQAYGTCAYGVDAQTCTAATPGAPNTGLALLTEPQILLPLIVGLSLMIASLIYLVKRARRRSRRNTNVNNVT